MQAAFPEFSEQAAPTQAILRVTNCDKVSFMDRRSLIKHLAATAILPKTLQSPASIPLPPRAEGELDLHHIDTGRGTCTLIVAPDGTTLMVDAGAAIVSTPTLEQTTCQAHPNDSRRPGEWQARYALRHSGQTQLDYFLATHIHQDHIGDLSAANPRANSGGYQLTGVSDVHELMPIAMHLDRGYPDYTSVAPPNAPFAKNYLAYLQHRMASKLPVAKVAVGSTQQIKLVHRPQRYRDFSVRILSATGTIWSGVGEQTHSLFPEHLSDNPPGENRCSVALRLTYGRFSYFTGGDLTADTQDGRLPWQDVESPIAKIAGRTEVATADHHGYFDACGPEFVRNLDAQAYLIQAWDIGHPAPAQLQRMLGAWGKTATRDVFATDMLPATELINRRFTGEMKSRHGHIVVRVAAGGATYRIHILDSTIEDGPVLASVGPYTCRD